MHWSRTNINLSVPDSLLNSGLYVHEESVISDAREEEELCTFYDHQVSCKLIRTYPFLLFE